MQGYRISRPHAAAECDRCAPAGQGHHLCQYGDCQNLASHSTRRHATLKEYLDLPISLRPVDGVAHQAVYACDRHDENLDPYCDHAAAEPEPCPDCGAAGDSPCVKKDGTTPRVNAHTARPVAVPSTCTHVHREDCPVFDGCQCTEDAAAPERPARPSAGEPGPDLSSLTDPLHIAQMVLAQARIPWPLVVAIRSCKTQDSRDAIGVEVRALDDAGNLARDVHGQPVIDSYVIAISDDLPGRGAQMARG